MSESQEQPWSDGPNAPIIPYRMYTAEKSRIAGISLGLTVYGVLAVLFFQCTAALFNSANRRREGIKWWLVAYTVLMFSCATTAVGTGLTAQLDCYIDNREYPGDLENPPGPLSYRTVLYPGALLMTNNLMFQLSYWLADGFLLYRCHAVFAKTFWVTAFPCLLYLGSVVTGIMLLISDHGEHVFWIVRDTIAYTLISVSLNFLLTLTIVTRIVLHGRLSVRTATGSPAGLSGLYKAVATMFIESSALYVGTSLLFVGLWCAGSGVVHAIGPILSVIQVIAPLLIIKRVANRTALTSDTITG